VSGAAIPAGGWFAGASSRAEVGQGPLELPRVAVLCAGPRGAAVAAAIAMALARACGRPCALAAAVGAGDAASTTLVPSAARAAAHLRRRGHRAHARGRLVWLADRRTEPRDGGFAVETRGVDGPVAPDPGVLGTGAVAADPAGAVVADPAGAAAALSTELSRAARAVEAPFALAIPFARSATLDRVLGWHDAVVVVRTPDATVALLQLVLASVAALDRPVVAVPVPGRLAATVATAGLHAPTFAAAAVAQLGIGGERR
jgi:hypothetical protein